MIDSHAHVALATFDADREEVIKRALAAGVTGWIEVGTDMVQSKKAIMLAEKYEKVYASVGIHPSDVGTIKTGTWPEIERLAAYKQVKAIGEVGLDVYRGGSIDEQRNVLERFVTLANQRSLPMIFHVRSSHEIDAHAALISFLRERSDSSRPAGVIHTYSGSVSQAEEYLKLGMYLSISGVVTFKNAGAVAEVAKSTPLDRLLIETDCPFLAPDPYRGQRNEPAYVNLVAKKIAELRGISIAEVDQTTSENTKKLFRLS